MDYVRTTHELTFDAAHLVLHACIGKAKEMGVPQCVAIVDAGGNLLAFGRMDGAKFHAERSARQKAVTAASTRGVTGGAPQDFGLNLSVATGGMTTNLKGGLPLMHEGKCLGAVGIGSGAPDQDVEVAQAGVDALAKALAGGQS